MKYQLPVLLAIWSLWMKGLSETWLKRCLNLSLKRQVTLYSPSLKVSLVLVLHQLGHLWCSHHPSKSCSCTFYMERTSNCYTETSLAIGPQRCSKHWIGGTPFHTALRTYHHSMDTLLLTWIQMWAGPAWVHKYSLLIFTCARPLPFAIGQLTNIKSKHMTCYTQHLLDESIRPPRMGCLWIMLLLPW